MEGTLSAGGTIFSTSGVVPGVPDSSIILGTQGRYTDRPTITYAPLVGERFARSMMTPLPPPSILSLIQAGYPVDGALRLAVHEGDPYWTDSLRLVMWPSEEPVSYQKVEAGQWEQVPR